MRRAVTGVDMPGPPQPAPSSRHRSVSPARPRQRDPLASLRSVLRRHTFDTLSLSNDVQGPALASADDQRSSATNRGFQPKGASYRERSMAGLTLTMEVLYQLS